MIWLLFTINTLFNHTQ